MQAFARELQSLASRLDRLSAGSQQANRGGRSRNRRGRGATTPGTDATPTQSNLSVGQTRGRRRNRRGRARGGGNINVNTGDVIITKAELITTVKLPANSASVKGHIDIIPDSFPFLKNFFSSFDRVQYQSIRFYWKPLVGTTYGGALAMGVDWDWALSDADRTKISALSPSTSMALWEDGEKKYPLILPKNRLQSRSWYLPRADQWQDKGPGKVIYSVDGTSTKSEYTVGDLWVKYTVVLSGTNPA